MGRISQIWPKETLDLYSSAHPHLRSGRVIMALVVGACLSDFFIVFRLPKGRDTLNSSVFRLYWLIPSQRSQRWSATKSAISNIPQLT